MFQLKTVSSLEKILPKLEYNGEEICSMSALNGEWVSFQAAFSTDTPGQYTFSVESDGDTVIKTFFTENVPVGLAAFPAALEDNGYISHEPGLFPDLLVPCDRDWVQANGIWQSLWFRVSAAPGDHKIKVTFRDSDGNTAAEAVITLTVSQASLPEQELIFTQWFHCDCIATYYKCPVFSERHWELTEKFLEAAHSAGMNMILTPVFTPPLDTAVGGERPTVQLLKIKQNGDLYDFDFSLLERWVKLCLKIGYKYFEMPHLFTQWGAKATPKIVAAAEEGEKRIFGWDVSADSKEYENFLSQMLPKLCAFLKQQGIDKQTYFHISDEPNNENIESYKAAKAVAVKYLKDCKIIEAVSDPEIYKKGYTDIPVIDLCAMKNWKGIELPERWCYYCCSDAVGVSNRLIAMPSSRNRSIGVQMFKHRTDGFLQWGFNFYYSCCSQLELDPFFRTDAYGAFPSGDAFSVYPGQNGPLPSLRLFVFKDALQDMRALKLLESLVGYDEAIKLAEDALGEEISFEHCFTADALIRMRDAINGKITEIFSGCDK